MQATPAATPQDDMSDILPFAHLQPKAPAISPYLVMQAQKEQAAGQHGPATLQLGQAALTSGAVHPAVAAMHGEMAGALPPGSAHKVAQATITQGPQGGASPQLSPVTPSSANPAGVAGSTQGDPGALGDMAGDVKSGLLSKTDVAGVAPGSKSMETDKDTDMAKRQVSMKQGFDPYQRQLQEAVSMGYSPHISGYKPLLDVNGAPIVDKATGGPVNDTSQPLYDITNLGIPNSQAPFQMNKAGIEKLKAMAQDRQDALASQPERPLDLTGLMMAADFANHTDTFGKDYARQQAQTEAARSEANKNSQEMYGEQTGIQKAQNDLYKDLNTSTNAGLNGGNILSQLANSQALTQMAGYGGAGMPRPPVPEMQNAKLAQMYSRDPGVQTSDKALSAANQLQNLLAQNTSPAVFMSKISALRATGLQRITNFELTDFNGDKRATEQGNTALEKLAYGDMTKMSADEIRQAVKVLAASAQQVSDNKRAFYHSTGLAMGASPDYVESNFGKPTAPNAVNNRGYSAPTHIPAPKAAQHPLNAVTPAGAADSVAQAWAKIHLQDQAKASDGQTNAAHAAAILQGK